MGRGRIVTLGRLGAVEGRADGPGPRAQLRRREPDAIQRGREHPRAELRFDRSAQEVEGRRDAAADDDDVGVDDHDHVGDADAQVAPDDEQTGDRRRVPGPGRDHGLLGGRGPTGGGDPVGAGERLEAAVVAAAARWSVGVERLMTELAARAVMPKVDAAVDGDHAADPGPKRQPDHGRGTSRRTQPQLGQAEGPRVIDQRGRQPQRRTDGAGDGPARPRSRDVDEEPRGPGCRVVQARDPDPDRGDARVALDRLHADRRKAGHDRLGAAGRRRRDLAPVEWLPVAGGVLDDDPLDVRPAKVEPEMSTRGRAVPHVDQDSAVTRVYAAATTTMIDPKRIWRTASGYPSDESRDDSTVRIRAPTTVPPNPPRPPMIEVPPITAAATDGRTYESARVTLVTLVRPEISSPAMAAKTAEMTYRTMSTCQDRAPESRAAMGLSPIA